MSISEIHRFARLGILSAIRSAAESGIDINSKDESGSTPLHCAIAQKQVQAAELLLQLGADATMQDADGLTALHYAVEHKMPGVLEALLERCPTAHSIADRHGNQPLWTAAFNARSSYEMVCMLLRYGADPNHQNHVKLSPIDIAKRINDSTMIRLLEAEGTG